MAQKAFPGLATADPRLPRRVSPLPAVACSLLHIVHHRCPLLLVCACCCLASGLLRHASARKMQSLVRLLLFLVLVATCVPHLMHSPCTLHLLVHCISSLCRLDLPCCPPCAMPAACAELPESMCCLSSCASCLSPARTSWCSNSCLLTSAILEFIVLDCDDVSSVHKSQLAQAIRTYTGAAVDLVLLVLQPLI